MNEARVIEAFRLIKNDILNLQERLTELQRKHDKLVVESAKSTEKLSAEVDNARKQATKAIVEADKHKTALAKLALDLEKSKTVQTKLAEKLKNAKKR